MQAVIKQFLQIISVRIRRSIYFDNNATTPVDPLAQKYMTFVQKNHFGNPSSLHKYGIEAREIIEKARMHVAAMIGADSDEIVFTGGGTEANNSIVKSVVALKRSGHIITSAIEHASLLQVFKTLTNNGFQVTYLGVDSSGRIRIDDLERAIRSDTILISIMHVNNEIGSIQSINDIGAIARSKGILFHSDIVQSFGKLPINVKSLQVDFLSISAHKINGPKGIGAMFIRRNAAFNPLLEGGHQERMFRAGTEAVVNIAGFGEACRVYKMADINLYRKKMAGIRNILIDGITKIFPNAKFNGESSSVLQSTLNITLPGIPNSEILAYFDFYKIALSVGSACVAGSHELSHVLVAIGLTDEEVRSSFRLSFGKYNIESEAQSVLNIFRKYFQERKEFFIYALPGELIPERWEEGSLVIVDIRDDDQKNRYPILPGTVHCRRTMNELKKLPKTRDVVLLCEDGYLSNLYASRLRQIGWKNVKSLMGGYKGWRQYHRDYYYYHILKGQH